MKKILVPVDFSGHTGITCAYALEYLRHTGGEIRLFHTYFDQIIISDTNFPDSVSMTTLYNEGLLKEVIALAERNMNDLKAELEEKIRAGALQGITITSVLTGGEIEQELKELCLSYHPDLVIMGTTGKGKNINVWGQVSTYIITHAKVPVMTVPDIESFRGFSNIMFAADLTDWNTHSVKVILDTFAGIPFHLYCVHFLLKGKTTDETEKMKALGDRFAEEQVKGQLSFELAEVTEDNQKAIDRFAAQHSVSLIAFQPYKHGFLYNLFTKNITKKNLFATNIPLLAIPAV
ncbi:MAG TPA: universal stress protein [Bacteroidales bacterium]|nr:universal stress protein [Bacteroidales bacterium]